MPGGRYLPPPSAPDGCNARALGADCDNCPLKDRPAIKPIITRNAQMVIMGEAPGYQEEAAQRFFIGRSGKLLDRSLSMFDLRRGQMHITNALLCRPGRSLSPKEWRQALRCCRPRLRKELSRVKAKFILAFGAQALLTLTGKAQITPWMGAPLQCAVDKFGNDFSKWKVLPTLHPAACLRSPAYTPVMQIHLERAWDMATGQLKEWKWPKLYLEPNKDALAALKRIRKRKLPTGFDIETDGTNPLLDTITCLGLSDGRDTVSVPWHRYVTRKYGDVPGIEEYAYGPEIAEVVASILSDPKIPKVMQNGSHDILGARHQAQLEVQNYEFDTMLAHAVCAPRINHNLGFIACCEFHASRWKTEFNVKSDLKGSDKFTQRDPLVLRDYNAKDALMTLLLRTPLLHRVQTQVHRGPELLARYMELTHHAMAMTERGVLVDPSRKQRHRKNFMRKKAKALRDLRRLAWRFKVKGGKQLNPHSQAQLHQLFFKKLRVQPKYYTPKGAPSLNEKFLKELLAHGNPAVAVAARLVLRFRRWAKLLSTYVDGLPTGRDNVVHPTWRVHGTRTGRWACFLMTIPKPQITTLKSGKKKVVAPGLRNLFIARPGYVFWQADYSQLELRLIALLSGDEKLLKAYAAGKDVHAENAVDIFKLQRTCTKDERDISKISVYLMNYGGDPQKMWKTIIIDFPNFTLRQAHWVHKNWFIEHYDIHRWQQNQFRTCNKLAYVEAPISGRRQHYQDGIIDRNEILNFPVQASGADVIDPALVRCAKKLKGHILLQVHDALCGESRVEDMLEDYRTLKREMEVVVKLNGHEMKMKVDIGIGDSWGSVVDCKNEDEVRERIKELC